MPKKIKFALKMKDGAEVRNLQELRDNFDLNQVTAYFLDGKLETWLKDRYYDELALSIQELNINDPDLQKKLCWILGVMYTEDKTEPIEKIKRRSWKLEKLKTITDDEEILARVDSVAFSQEELDDLLNEGMDPIYLCGDDFSIPEQARDKTYIGINTKIQMTSEKWKKYQRLITLLDEYRQNTAAASKAISGNLPDVDAVFLCKGYDAGEDINYLAYVGKEKELYEKRDEKYGAEGIDLKFQYKAPLKIVKIPDVLRYIDAVYHNGKIIYIAEDGQGKLLASFDTISGEIKELRRWNVIVTPYYMGRNCVTASYYANKSFHTEEISVDGKIRVLPENIKEQYLWNLHELRNGLYGMVNSRDLVEIYDVFRDKQYTIPIVLGENVENWKLKVFGNYAEYDTGKIYFFMGTGQKGFFYVFDSRLKEVRLATTIPVQRVKKHFCVKGDRIVYYGSPNDNKAKLMVLDTKSGKQKCLWEGIGEKYGFNIGDMKLIGDYLYIMNAEGEKACRIKIDGTERTCIFEKSEDSESGLNGMKDTDCGIERIVEICTEDRNGIF